jgi:hypothetical protein
MAKTSERLSAVKVKNLKAPGYFRRWRQSLFSRRAERCPRLDLSFRNARPHA